MCALLVRKDLKMSKGKIVAQCGHAMVYSILNTSKEKLHLWQDCGEKIVSLSVKDEKTMDYIYNISQKNKIVSHIVVDAGRTQVLPNTRTVCVIGPDTENKIKNLVKDLKLL